MRELLYDLRDTWRGLLRDRLYAGAVIGTLALTLGAAIAVYSIVEGVLLRPLAYPEPGRLVSIREVLPGIADRYPTLPVTLRHFDLWRDRATSFSAMAAMDWRTSTLTRLGDPAQVVVLRTSGTLFDVLRIPTAIGRGLTREDEDRERPRVAVISDQLWHERLGGDPDVLGRTVTLNGLEHTIVGVLPRAAGLPRLQPLDESGTISHDVAAIVPFQVSLDDFDWMGQFNFGVVARLRPDVGLEQARAEMDVLQRAVADIATRATGEAADLRGWMMPLTETIVGQVRRGLVLLLGSIGALLLIACANLANLTLTRTIGRLRDAAVRGALGASRWRLVRSVLVDLLVLAAIGGALALLTAEVALRLFVTTAPISLPRVEDVTIDGRVLAVGGAVALVAALAVGLVPAWRLGRTDLEALLRGSGRTTDRGTNRLRSLLLTIQVALSVALLAVGGLFVTSLGRLMRVETGFGPEGAVTIEIAPGGTRYPDIAARAVLYGRILDGVHALPGVVAAAWTSALPLTGETWVDKIIRPDAADPNSGSSSANYRFVGPEYFQAIGMPMLQGRSFEEREREAAVTPAVISLRAARALWPGQDPIGRQFTRANPQHRFEIVGLVADGRVTSLEAESPLMVYAPYWFNNEGKSVLVVRSRQSESGLASAVRTIVRRIDPDIAIARVAPLEQVVDTAVEGRRYQAVLLSTFAGAALLIALLGVYATTAYGVSRRNRELNIRIALGAQLSQVFTMVIRESIWPVAAGLAAGLAGALALGGAVAALLYQVRPRDPVVLATVVAIVGTVGLVSAAAATMRGLRIDPAAALRDD